MKAKENPINQQSIKEFSSLAFQKGEEFEALALTRLSFTK